MKKPTTFTVTTTIKGKEYKATAETYAKAFAQLLKIRMELEAKEAKK